MILYINHKEYKNRRTSENAAEYIFTAKGGLPKPISSYPLNKAGVKKLDPKNPKASIAQLNINLSKYFISQFTNVQSSYENSVFVIPNIYRTLLCLINK